MPIPTQREGNGALKPVGCDAVNHDLGAEGCLLSEPSRTLCRGGRVGPGLLQQFQQLPRMVHQPCCSKVREDPPGSRVLPED